MSQKLQEKVCKWNFSSIIVIMIIIIMNSSGEVKWLGDFAFRNVECSTSCPPTGTFKYSCFKYIFLYPLCLLGSQLISM